MLNFFGNRVDDRAATITTLPAADLPEALGEQYSFLIIADAHFGSKSTNQHLDRFLAKFKELCEAADKTKRPAFLINLGDIMDDGFQKEADAYLALEKKMKKIALGKGVDDDVPEATLATYRTYAIVGNHDLYAQDGWDIWTRNIFPGTKYNTSYYNFTLGGFTYYFLDTGNATLGLAQLEDLEKRLSADAKPKLVFMHYPISLDNSLIFTSFCLQNTKERNRLIHDFVRSDVRQVFTGHYHPGNENDFGNLREKTVKSFGYKEIVLLVHVDDSTKSVSYEEISF